MKQGESIEKYLESPDRNQEALEKMKLENLKAEIIEIIEIIELCEGYPPEPDREVKVYV